MEQKRILVVDDEKNIRFTVVHSLQSPELVVDAASSGVEGLQLFSSGHYDLLLVDLRMPGMTGLEMLRELRRLRPDLPPAVVITAYGIPQQLLEAAELGAIDFIRKPFSIQTIRATVREIIDRVQIGERLVPKTANDFVRRGKFEMMIGHRPEAVTYFERAIELEPDSVEPYVLKGIGSLIDGKYDAARSAFRYALYNDPLNTTASEYLAWLVDAQA